MELPIRTKVRSILLSLGCMSNLIGCAPPPAATDNTQPNSNSPATVSPAPAAIIGSSSQEDAIDDVRNGNYQKPQQELPGIDLTATTIESVGVNLKVTFKSSSSFPATIPVAQSAVWTITACTPSGDQCLICGAKVIGNEWLTYLFDMSSARNTYVSPPVLKGNELMVELPRDRLPGWMQRPFTWSADSEWNGIWKDRIPDTGEGILNAPTIPFPK